ncbi:hypothetical protein KC337_g33 [Hortaea werneckii]|nr:hypothetical protein KC337_g33 [Hortaea werneckii]
MQSAIPDRPSTFPSRGNQVVRAGAFIQPVQPLPRDSRSPIGAAGLWLFETPDARMWRALIWIVPIAVGD